MSLYEWEMMQNKKEDLKNSDKETNCFHPKENPVEDERAVETLNVRSLRIY